MQLVICGISNIVNAKGEEGEGLMRLRLFTYAIVVQSIFLMASTATAKPPTPDYSSNSSSSQSASGVEAGKAALGFAAKRAVEKVAEAEVPKIAQAATTTAVFDRTSDAARALDYGRYAGTAARGVFAAKQVYDLSKLYYGLGGAATDIKALGLEEGSIAASERLSKIDVAKPLVAVGNYLGEKVAAVVQKYRQNRNKASNPKKARKEKPKIENSNDKAQHPNLDDHDRVDQSGEVAIKDEPLDSCKTNDATLVVREMDTSQVGVRGWCTCGAEHGKIYQCGVGSFMPSFNLGDYLYELCARCGKILKPNKTDKEAKIIDMRIDRKYRGDSGLIGGIPLHKYEALLKQAENKLLDIPDGEIVIRGTCVCKEPDPIHVGFLDWGYSPYVCILCGRVRLPDKDGSIPNGPTALSEMGLDKQAESARERMLEWIEHNR